MSGYNWLQLATIGYNWLQLATICYNLLQLLIIVPFFVLSIYSCSSHQDEQLRSGHHLHTRLILGGKFTYIPKFMVFQISLTHIKIISSLINLISTRSLPYVEYNNIGQGSQVQNFSQIFGSGYNWLQLVQLLWDHFLLLQ